MPRSTFFYHQQRLSKPDKHAVLKQAIRESFERNKHRYGYRRVLLDLRNQGWVVNHKLVYKLTVATSPSTAFTAGSLAKAINTCAPEPGWMMHTDQGFQYQHASWRNLIGDNGGVQSMSRKANCYDNAVMENFFGHVKTEMYHGEVFDTVAEFNQAIDEYIGWYNTERVQQRLKGLTPMQYRNQTLEALTA